MTAHNLDEGSRFIQNTVVTDESSYAAYLKYLILPLARNDNALNYITQVLYPPIFDGSQGYTTQAERNNLIVADANLVCNTRFLSQADFSHPTYAYMWSAPPAVHGADLPYIFYDFDPAPGVNITVAETMQGYFTGFAETGQPNAPSLPLFDGVRGKRTVQELGIDGIRPVLDEGGIRELSERCRFWQEVPYLGAPSTTDRRAAAQDMEMRMHFFVDG